MFSKISPEIFDFYGYFLIILITDHTDNNQLLHNIFDDFWSKSILNVNILTPNDTRDLVLYTYTPFADSRDCTSIRTIAINLFRSDSSAFTEKLYNKYPRKTLNMNQCWVTVACFESIPFTFVKRSNVSGELELTGADGPILNELSKRLNFKLKVIAAEDNGGRGIIFSNGTITGVMGLVCSNINTIY